MIDGAPKVVRFAIDLDENLIDAGASRKSFGGGCDVF